MSALLTLPAFSQEDIPSMCLGFPSGAKFNCTLVNGKTYLIDIPDGSGCNQLPEKGTVDGMFTIYEPNMTFDLKMNAKVNFYTDAEKTQKQTLECAQYSDVE